MVKILVTDDSEFMRSLIKKSLAAAGYKDIIEASSAQEAINKYKTEKPDLVLLDIVMDEPMAGITALKGIKSLNKNAKVIMVTVVDQPKITEEAMKLGANGYITKPIDSKKLIDTIKKVLG